MAVEVVVGFELVAGTVVAAGIVAGVVVVVVVVVDGLAVAVVSEPVVLPRLRFVECSQIE